MRVVETRAGVVFVLAVVVCLAGGSAADRYMAYVEHAPEFQRVRQDPAVMIGRWDTWIYMPWRYQWTIGTDERGGRFCEAYGFNGGFTDHGEGPLAWLEKWNLRFYNDHTAGKGDLYLRRKDFKPDMLNPRALRNGGDGPHPLDDAMLARLRETVTRNVNRLKVSPVRVAYALDDEISWGSFVMPLAWRLHDNDADYEAWLKRYYGEKAPAARYVNAEFARGQLGRALKDIDFSPFLDRMTYNNSYWANFLGKLVDAANAADPDTPCGFVGGQAPNLYGGYDYAKLCKKIQFIEAYNIGSSQEIIRSFNPDNAMPQVTTHFHKDALGTANDIWQVWYYFAHGNRGMIGWVENWFDGARPKDWLKDVIAVNKEVGGTQGRKLVGARWVHDGVAIYYSHPSIQVSWCLDIEPHGKTWVNRNGDDRLGTSHLVRKAWECLLADSGIQYNFIPYDEVVLHGVPSEYRVVILPACYALSDAEAHRFADFCRRGGTVIADFACGLFDQHGKGRTTGALDALFGVRHDGTETKNDFFGGNLWVEMNQDKGFYYKSYRELLDTVDCRREAGFAVAEHKLSTRLARNEGPGRAVYLNLSPLRYLQYREEGATTDAQRDVFMRDVLKAGVTPRVAVKDASGRRPKHCETTYWRKGDRTYCFVIQNAAVTGSAQGGGGAKALDTGTQPIVVVFDTIVRDVVDERTGRKWPSGREFAFDFNPVEAVLFSYCDSPSR